MSERNIPQGAIKIIIGAVQQKDGYSCGAAVWMAVALAHGVGSDDQEKVKQMLGTNSEHGTYFKDLVRCFNEAGFEAQAVPDTTREQLQRLIDARVPCLLSVQAWAEDPSVYDDPDHNSDGHYVVAVGYDDDGYFYFMDPSQPGCYSVLHWSELDKRWHENEGMGDTEVYRHLAIVVRPGMHQLCYQTKARRIG